MMSALKKLGDGLVRMTAGAAVGAAGGLALVFVLGGWGRASPCGARGDFVGSGFFALVFAGPFFAAGGAIAGFVVAGICQAIKQARRPPEKLPPNDSREPTNKHSVRAFKY